MILWWSKHILLIFFLLTSVQWTCTWLTTRAFLDVLARLGTSWLPTSRWFWGYLMWHMIIYRYTDYVLSLVHSLFPNLASLSQDLPLILDITFGGMPPHKQSAGLLNLTWDLGACLVRGGVRLLVIKLMIPFRNLTNILGGEPSAPSCSSSCLSWPAMSLTKMIRVDLWESLWRQWRAG